MLLLVVAATGCQDHLVGLHDTRLHFIVRPTPPPEDLRDRVSARLAAAEIAADVASPHKGELTVRVDGDFAEETRRLLLWPGGLAIAKLDDAATRDLPKPQDDTRREMMRRIRELPMPPGRMAALEPLEGRRARAQVLEWPPMAVVDAEGVVVDGPRVTVPIAPDAEAILAGMAASQPTSVVAVVRDRTILAVATAGTLVDHHRLVVPLGTSITAYTDAADAARLLATPRLPALEESSRDAVAPDWLLASANLVLPFVVSFAWLFFVRRFDRAQPEPLWLVILTFALGAIAVVPAGLVEWGWATLSPYTNPTMLTFGRTARAFPVALVGFILTVGVTEEGAKLLATWSVATHRREFDEPVDGIVYGAAAALGFAAAENIRYFALGRVGSPLLASRAFMSVPAHLFFGSIWGYALGRRLVRPDQRVWPLFLAAAALHGLFDTCLSIDGAGLAAFVVVFAAASIFIVHLRKALRYGAIARDGNDTAAPVDRGTRELFRMGSPGVFASFVVAVYLLSAVVFYLSVVFHSARASVVLGLASAIALGLLGWAARGIAEALPLDVVVDDLGVTFAGAAIEYRDVLRIERRRVRGSPRRQEQMLIVGDARRLVLGPASRDTMDALALAVATRLSSVALR